MHKSSLLQYARCLTFAIALAYLAPGVNAQSSRSVAQRTLLNPATSPEQIFIDRAAAENNNSVASKVGPGRRVALVIGNANYQRVPKLQNAVNDAQDMCASLSRLGFEVACHYNVMNRSDIRQVVRTFTSKLQSDTVALFYYAGHGVQINGENFLLPISIDPKVSLDQEDDSLNLSYLLRSLEAARSSPNIVILDACRDNPFDRVPGGGKGLARVDPPIGTVLVYATAPNGVAIDGDGRNGLFTKHLLRHLGDPGRKLDELFQVVALGVEQESLESYKSRQIPYRSFSFSGGYCLAGCEDPKVTAQIQLIKRQSEEAASRVRSLTDENARLLRLSEERSAIVLTLESKINALTRDAASAGNQNSSNREELLRLQVALEKARGDQRKAEELKTEVAKREAEISELKGQMAVLSGKATQLEEYRQRITILEKENADKARVTEQIDQVKRQSDEATKRVNALTEENAKLRQQAQERHANVAALESKIDTLTKEAASAGSLTNATRAELARLQISLNAARSEQKASEGSHADLARRDQEIAALKSQISGFQQKANQLEELRQKIIALEKENADKTQQLSNNEAMQEKVRPAVIPSF